MPKAAGTAGVWHTLVLVLLVAIMQVCAVRVCVWGGRMSWKGKKQKRYIGGETPPTCIKGWVDGLVGLKFMLCLVVRVL